MERHRCDGCPLLLLVGVSRLAQERFLIFWRRLTFFLIAGMVFLPCINALSADDLADVRNRRATAFSPSSKPPTDLAGWVQRGDIRWCFGPSNDPRRTQGGATMAAETAYTVAFNYRSRIQWRRQNGKLIVSVRRLTISWKPRHVVWFRDRPSDDGFWDNRLVRHEMDHVKISSDPRLEKLCRDRMKQLKVLEGPIPSDGNDRAAANAILQKRVQEVFQDVSDMAKIRYKELDRITRHGLQPLPENIDWVPRGDYNANRNR